MDSAPREAITQLVLRSRLLSSTTPSLGATAPSLPVPLRSARRRFKQRSRGAEAVSSHSGVLVRAFFIYFLLVSRSCSCAKQHASRRFLVCVEQEETGWVRISYFCGPDRKRCGPVAVRTASVAVRLRSSCGPAASYVCCRSRVMME